MITRRLFLALAGAAPVGLCLSRGTARATETLPVVASFSILADFARQVGGERVAVTSLVGPETDAHGYQPNPADAKILAGAALLVVNGLGFDAWSQRLERASGFKGVVVTASDGVAVQAAPAGGADRHGHAHGGRGASEANDPHAWQSIANAKVYVANIRDGLLRADPAGRAVYEANAGRYLATLDALEAEVRGALAGLPEPSRKVITSHDAFGYFARAYGFTFLSPQGVSTESEPSAKGVARLIRQIKAEKVTALFVEALSDQRLIEQIGRETGARIGGKLFSDALSGPGGPAPTYVEMMRHNVRTLVAALAGPRR